MMTQAKVGIFFVIKDEIILDAVPREQGERYGDTVGFGGHYDYWQTLMPQNSVEQLFKSHAYDYYPRGRVVYFMKSGYFRLYADRCIRQADVGKIAAAFHLPSCRLARDEHYQCAGCNAEYLDV